MANRQREQENTGDFLVSKHGTAGTSKKVNSRDNGNIETVVENATDDARRATKEWVRGRAPIMSGPRLGVEMRRSSGATRRLELIGRYCWRRVNLARRACGARNATRVFVYDKARRCATASCSSGQMEDFI